MKPPEFRDRIDAAVAEGWRIEEDGDQRVVLKKPNFGSAGAHLVIALLTAWWTFGVVNAIYAAVKYLNDTHRRVLRADEFARSPARHREHSRERAGERSTERRSQSTDTLPDEDAMQLLKLQYARGELSDEEFDRRVARLTDADDRAREAGISADRTGEREREFERATER